MFLPCALLQLIFASSQAKDCQKVKTSQSSIKTGAGSMHPGGAKMCYSPGLPYTVASGDGVCSASTSDETAQGSVATTTRYFHDVEANSGMRELSNHLKCHKQALCTIW